MLLLRPELFLELLGRDPEEFFDVRAKVAVVEIAELFADVVQIYALVDHALGEQSPMVTKKILGLEAHGIFHVTLQLNDRETKYFCNSFDVEVVLLRELKKIYAGGVYDPGSLAMKWCWNGWPAHEWIDSRERKMLKS